MLLSDDRMMDDTTALSEENIAAILENCQDTAAVITLLSNQSSLQYFKFNTSQYCQLHKLIITKIGNPEELVEFLKAASTFHESIREREKFYIDFVECIPALEQAVVAYDREDVLEAASKVIQKCIFNSRQFECFLTDLFEKRKCEEKHKLCKFLLNFLSAHPQCIKLFISAFVRNYQYFVNTYQIVLVLTEIIGFNVRDDFDFKLKHEIVEPSLSDSLQTFYQILTVLERVKVSFDFKLTGVSFNDFLRNILQTIISITQVPDALCLKIISKAIDINPLLIESITDDVINYVTPCANTHKNEYEALIIKIFQVFSRLHRIQNFIAKVIPTLKNTLNGRELCNAVYSFKGKAHLPKDNNLCYNIEEMFSAPVLNCFTECVVSLASWQVINLLKTMLFHLKGAVDDLSQVKETYIEILTVLTCRLLLSVRMAEHTVAESTVSKFLQCLEDLGSILATLGKTILCREHNHILMKSFLSLCYHWVEVYLILEYYSEDIKMLKSCNKQSLAYLHSYLNEQDWELILQRINNFGAKPCKEQLQKLQVQKAKALFIFENEFSDEFLKTLTEFDLDLEIWTDRFITKNFFERLESSQVLTVCEALAKDPNIMRLPHIQDSQIITKGVLSVIFTKLHRLLKQKRKLDDSTTKKTLFCRAFAALPPTLFLSDENVLLRISDVLKSHCVDVTIPEERILTHLDAITQLPVLFCDQQTQKLIVLLLLSLVKNFPATPIAGKCEFIVLSIIEYGKHTLLDLLDAEGILDLLKIFQMKEKLFSAIASNAFKSDQGIESFLPLVHLIKDDLKAFLHFGVTLLLLINRIKKVKVSTESKEKCLAYKTLICKGFLNLIVKSSPEDCLVEPFALVFKALVTKNDDDFEKLKVVLPQYTSFCFESLNPSNLKGSLLLFSAILNNKSVVEDDFVLKTWECVKKVSVTEDIREEYSQLVTLIVTLMPNQQFEIIFKDLSSEEANLKTWTSIVSTHLNSAKTDILRLHLEFLLSNLVQEKKSCEEVLQFEISLIQASHIPLTSSMIDFIFLSGSHCFHSCLSILESLLKFRNHLVMDRLPPFLLQYRSLLTHLCDKSSAGDDMTDFAHKFEKLTKILVQNTKYLSRIAMYLIADILGRYEVLLLPPGVKKHLDNCIYSLIALCDHHAVRYLMRVLSGASTEMFKIMFENYKKYYRFTGKV